jgi:hypothetical protein
MSKFPARFILLSDHRVVAIVMFGYATIITALATAVSAGMIFLIRMTSYPLTSYAGTILWDGRFNEMTSSADLNKCNNHSYQFYL